MRHLRICVLLALGAAIACIVCDKTNLGEVLSAPCSALEAGLAK